MSTKGIHRDNVTAWFERHGAEAFVGRIDNLVAQAADYAAKVA